MPKFQKEKMKTCVFKSFFRGSLSKFRNKNSDQQHVLRHLPRAYQKTSSFGGIFSDLVISSVLCVFRKKGVCLARMNKRHEVSGSGLLLGLQGWLVPFCLTPTTYWPVILPSELEEESNLIISKMFPNAALRFCDLILCSVSTYILLIFDFGVHMNRNSFLVLVNWQIPLSSVTILTPVYYCQICFISKSNSAVCAQY